MADALSRVMEDGNNEKAVERNITALTVVLCNWVKALQESWEKDSTILKIIQDL